MDAHTHGQNKQHAHGLSRRKKNVITLLKSVLFEYSKNEVDIKKFR